MEKKERKTKLSGAEKKAETIRQRQDQLKRKLLEILEEAPNLGAALARVGINRSTFSRWREDDPNFSLDANHAIERAIDHTADSVELSLLSSARNGNVHAQKYFLGHNHQKYMPKQWVEQVANPLTPERIAQIEVAMRAWDSKDDEDWQDSDFEISKEEEDDNNSPYDENGYLKK